MRILTTIMQGICRLSILNVACLSLAAAAGLIALYTSPYMASSLDVVPDSVEYSVGAAHLVRDKSYFITVEGTKFPPRYSPAFSLILAPSYLVLGTDEIGNGIYIVTAFALLGIMAAYAIGHALSGCPGAVLAAGSLLLVGDYREFDGKIMADVPGAALSLLVCWLYLQLCKRLEHGKLLMFASGCVIALAAGLRPALLSLVLPFLFRSRRSVAGILNLLLPIASVIGLTLLYNLRTFGSPFRNGYNFWCPVPYDFFKMTLSLSYLQENFTTLLSTPILPAMIATGLCLVLLRKQNLIEKSFSPVLKEVSYFILIASLPYLVFHLLYFYQLTRFFLPVTCLSAALTGGVAARFVAGRAYNHAAIIFSATLLIFASVQKTISPAPVPWRRAVAETIARFTPDDAVIIASTDPAYLGYMIAENAHRVIIPLNRNVEYASKLIAPRKIAAIDPPPDGWWDHRAAGLVKAGATEAVGVVAVERPDVVDSFLKRGRRVFLLQDMTTREDLSEAETFVRNYSTGETAPGLFELRRKNAGDLSDNGETGNSL